METKWLFSPTPPYEGNRHAQWPPFLASTPVLSTPVSGIDEEGAQCSPLVTLTPVVSINTPKNPGHPNTPKKPARPKDVCFICKKASAGNCTLVYANVAKPEDSEIMIGINKCFNLTPLPHKTDWGIKVCRACKKAIQSTIQFKNNVEQAFSEFLDKNVADKENVSPDRFKRMATKSPTGKGTSKSRRRHGVPKRIIYSQNGDSSADNSVLCTPLEDDHSHITTFLTSSMSLNFSQSNHSNMTTSLNSSQQDHSNRMTSMDSSLYGNSTAGNTPNGPKDNSNTTSMTSQHDHSIPAQASDSLPRDRSEYNCSQSVLDAFSITPVINNEERKAVISVLKDRNADSGKIARKILKQSKLRLSIEKALLCEVNTVCHQLCSLVYKPGPSVLRTLPLTSEGDMLLKAGQELERNMPFVHDLLCTMACSPGTSNPNVNFVVPTIYAMTMQTRNKHLSAVQKLNTCAALRHHAGNGLLAIFNKCGLTLAPGSKYDLLNVMGSFNMAGVTKSIRDGRPGKITCDNIDGMLIANQVRRGSGNKHYHYTASTYYPDRIDVSALDMRQPTFPHRFDGANFYLTMAEEAALKDMYGYMIGRVLVKHIKGFSWMEACIPKHIPHEHSETMAQKSEIYPLKIILKDPKYHNGCLDVMDELVQSLTACYEAAGRRDDVEYVYIILGGDQLVRVRMVGGQDLRRGTYTREQMLEMLTPVIIELFHMEQDFLDKLVQRFWLKNSSRVKGSLPFYKGELSRTNVNGQVKSRFQAHEDFVSTVGEGLLLEFALDQFNMADTKAAPVIPDLPNNIDKMHIKNRMPHFKRITSHLVNALFTPFRQNEDPRVFEFNLGDNRRLNIHAERFGDARFLQFHLPGNLEPLLVENPDRRDELFNYNVQLLQWYLHLKEFQDGIKEGDPFRTTINIKRMIPFFRSHSALSKYAVECIDYIQKVELLLPEALALRVQLGSFVNPHGAPGGNKAADMQQENNIKAIKEINRGLGAGQTDEAMVRASLAAPVISDVVDLYEHHLGIHKSSGTHKGKDNTDDVLAVAAAARRQQPFVSVSGRKMERHGHLRADPFHSLERDIFHSHILVIARRLRRGLEVLVDDEDEEEMENEE